MPGSPTFTRTTPKPKMTACGSKEVRQVFMPLPVSQEDCLCDICGDVGLNLCARCNERVYCSTECQRRDWKAHKPFC
ncbi:hypothetical protein EIP91_002892, partial [Steccherinum ochraceum]